MGNLDFTNQAEFSWYCVFLLISGVAMLCATGVPGQTSGSRALNALFGLGFTGYALYLIFQFQGGTYHMFIYAFILPFIVIGRTVQAAAAKRNAKSAVPYQAPVMNYGADGQPQQNAWQQYGQQTAQPAEPAAAAPAAAPQPQPAPEGGYPRG